MKSVVASTVALLATAASSAPLEARQSSNIDVTVLQFALTLEHLENVFYKGALQKFSERDFERAGYSKDYYNNLKYIAHDEEEHVKLLSGALSAAGASPVQACKYDFPYNDVHGFIGLSSALEGVGTSAYLGGAPLITSKDYLTVAGSILVTEAKHTSLQRLANGEVPIANPYGTPLDPTSVYTLAAAFIKSCPSSNMALPFKPYPALSVEGDMCTNELIAAGNPSEYVKRGLVNLKLNFGGKHGGWSRKDGDKEKSCHAPSAGTKVEFSADKKIPKGSYVTFVSGLMVVSVKGDVKGKMISAEIPAAAEGQTYVFISSKDNEGALDSSSVLFGPAILEVAPQPPTIDYSYQK